MKYTCEIRKPRICYIPKGLSVNYEKEYGYILDEAFGLMPTNSDDFLYQLRYIERWTKKSIPQLLEKKRPDAAFAIAIELCRRQPLFMERDVMQVYLGRYKKRIRKLIMDGFRALGETVTVWNNEEKRQFVCDFIKEQAPRYAIFRGVEKAILALMPITALAGDPISITREMNDDELEEKRLKERQDVVAEREKRIAERETMSVIPLNDDFETRIFTVLNIDLDCDSISYMMHDEGGKMLSLIDDEEYDLAALRFMQLIKSMCRHFVSDEHYCYFDDGYSPDYVVSALIDKFNMFIKTHTLPNTTIDYLRRAWKEVLEEESYKDYGIPSKKLHF